MHMPSMPPLTGVTHGCVSFGLRNRESAVDALPLTAVDPVAGGRAAGVCLPPGLPLSLLLVAVWPAHYE